MEYQYLIYNIENRVAWITLNRPKKLNALNKPLWMEVQRALKQADSTNEVSVIALTGSGRAFCAGDDIDELLGVQSPKAAEELFLGCVYGMVNTIFQLQKPFLAAINGLAYGGGCELVLLTDIAVASENAKFAQPEARIGAWPPIFAIFGPAVVGFKATQELLLSGEPIDAKRAFEIGLINHVVEDETVKESTMEIAEKLMKCSPASLRIIKETVMNALGHNLYAFRVACQRLIHEVSKTDDFSEGAKAFLEKRSPLFKKF
jgi:enoyl-CoA hydratase/3-hydroxyacyl-CoA dehydrogenase